MSEQFVRNQIKLLLRIEGFSITRLAGGNSALQVRLNNQINRDTTLSVQTILYIMERFPEVSAEWLITGEGDMLRSGDKVGVGSAELVSNGSVGCDDREIERLQQENKELKEENRQLREQVTNLTNVLANITRK